MKKRLLHYRFTVLQQPCLSAQIKLFGLFFDQLDQAHFSSVTAAETEFENAGVTTVAACESRSNNVKEVFDSITAVQFGESQTTAVKITLFASGDELFSETAEFFGLDQCGFDLTVDEQAVRHVGEHRSAMGA
jgi:hypothetical protein